MEYAKYCPALPSTQQELVDEYEQANQVQVRSADTLLPRIIGGLNRWHTVLFTTRDRVVILAVEHLCAVLFSNPIPLDSNCDLRETEENR